LKVNAAPRFVGPHFFLFVWFCAFVLPFDSVGQVDLNLVAASRRLGE
jgi:hypothetical protein